MTVWLRMNHRMNPFVRHVRPVGGSTLDIEFETGERRVFDMTPYLRRGVFTRLRDRSIFMSARVVAGSVEWSGGIDLSYDTLYVESRPSTVNPEYEHGVIRPK